MSELLKMHIKYAHFCPSIIPQLDLRYLHPKEKKEEKKEGRDGERNPGRGTEIHVGERDIGRKKGRNE
jgi:hypothetical protein